MGTKHRYNDAIAAIAIKMMSVHASSPSNPPPNQSAPFLRHRRRSRLRQTARRLLAQIPARRYLVLRRLIAAARQPRRFCVKCKRSAAARASFSVTTTSICSVSPPACARPDVPTPWTTSCSRRTARTLAQQATTMAAGTHFEHGIPHGCMRASCRNGLKQVCNIPTKRPYSRAMATLNTSKPCLAARQLLEKQPARRQAPAIINAFTRMRVCARRRDGLSIQREIGDVPDGLLPWFRLPQRKTADQTIVFGHWSALGFAKTTPFVWIPAASGDKTHRLPLSKR